MCFKDGWDGRKYILSWQERIEIYCGSAEAGENFEQLGEGGWFWVQEHFDCMRGRLGYILGYWGWVGIFL